MEKKVFIVPLLVLSLFVLGGCTKKDAQEAINMIPLIGDDEEMNEAVMKKDITLCEKLTGKDELAQIRRQNKCMEKIAKVENDYQACYLIKKVDDPEETDYEAGNDCAMAIVAETGDLAACEKIERIGFNDAKKCYAIAAPILKDATICSKTGDGPEWKTCIRETAKAAENIAICDNFEVYTLKASCQLDVATAKKDASLCERIEQEDRKDSCYQKIAQETEDPSLCDKISKDSRKENCEESIESAD